MAVIVIAIVWLAVFVGREVANLTVVDDLAVGECIEDHFGTSGSSESGEFFTVLFVSRVDCSQPHAYEVYAMTDSLWGRDALFPGVDRAFQDGDEYCWAQFVEVVGVGAGSAELDFFTFVPPQDAWSEGGRDVRCIVGYADGASLAIGSLEGVGG